MANRFFSLLLGLGALLLAASCSSLLYYPTPYMYVQNTSKLKPAPRDIFFNSVSGIKLHAWHFKNTSGQKTKALVVLFHGNAQNLTSHFYSLHWILSAPYDLLVFDYPGYGLSMGNPTPQNTVEAGVAALKWAKDNSPAGQPLVVYGQSLGGAIAMRTLQELGPQSGVKLLVLDSTFASYRKAGQKLLSRHWLTWPFQWTPYLLLSDKWGPKRDHLKDLNYLKSILVIHADHDPVISFRLGQSLFQELPEPKKFWQLPSQGHVNGFFCCGTKYRDDFLNWLDAGLSL